MAAVVVRGSSAGQRMNGRGKYRVEVGASTSATLLRPTHAPVPRLDAELADLITETVGVALAINSVVLDLSELSLTSRALASDLVTRLSDIADGHDAALILVARRLTARRLLARHAASAGLALVASVDNALNALRAGEDSERASHAPTIDA